MLSFLKWSFAIYLFQGLIYVYADTVKNNSVLALAQRVPVYYPIEIRSYTEGLAKQEAAYAASTSNVQQDLAYPGESIALDKTADRPDIFIIALDSWRSDMLQTHTSPHIAKFSENSVQFQQHFSGGNATRHGIFSLFYGLPGSYWRAVLSARKEPVLMSVLKERGYDMAVFSS